MRRFSLTIIFRLLTILLIAAIVGRFILSLEYVYDFLINENWIDMPEYHVKLSQQRKLNISVSIIGLGKNIIKPNRRLQKNLNEIEFFGRLFRSFQIIYVDGNSSDGTLEEVRKWKETSRAEYFDVLLSGNPPVNESKSYYRGVFLKLPREGRLAMERNLALKQLDSRPETDFTAIFDMDMAGWDIETTYHTILHTILHTHLTQATSMPNSSSPKDPFLHSERRSTSKTSVPSPLSSSILPYAIPKWDVMCSNGIVAHGVYKDSYAFRGSGFGNTNHHYVTNRDDYRDYNLSWDDWWIYRKNFLDAQNKVRAFHSTWNHEYGPVSKQKTPFLRVESCFGGLAIYRSHLFKGCKYDYRYQDSPYMIDCEHVFLHKCMAEKHGAKVYTNRAIKLWAGDSIFKKKPLKVLQDFFDIFLH